jgi:hypothetical protein
MVESDITTHITVTKNTDALDGLKGLFPTLDSIVDLLETRLDTACDNLAQRTAVQLLEYERAQFSSEVHPFAKGVGENSFYAESEGDCMWVVDNSAENKGFPYMVTEELGDGPGRKLPAHPFAAPARGVVIDEIEDLWKEVMG